MLPSYFFKVDVSFLLYRSFYFNENVYRQSRFTANRNRKPFAKLAAK